MPHADTPVSREIAEPIMHFSLGKIQQRVRSAQRFSHLKCIEFITYSRPTGARAQRGAGLLPSLVAPLIDNVFSRGRDFRVSFVIVHPTPVTDEAPRAVQGTPTRELSAAENKIAMEKLRRALTGDGGLYRARVLVSGTSAFHSRLQIPKITAVERTCRGATLRCATLRYVTRRNDTQRNVTRCDATRRNTARRDDDSNFREASHAVARIRYISFVLFFFPPLFARRGRVGGV